MGVVFPAFSGVIASESVCTSRRIGKKASIPCMLQAVAPSAAQPEKASPVSSKTICTPDASTALGFAFLSYIDYQLFQYLIQFYVEAGGQLPADWENLYWRNYGRLEWLEYNGKRALGIACSAEEIEVGISEVKDTVAHVIYYHDAKKIYFKLFREYHALLKMLADDWDGIGLNAYNRD